MKYFLLVVFGLLAGVCGGMGMGGGTLLIPLLSLLKVPQQTAQAVNLVSFVPMAVVALIFHVKNRLVDFGSAWIMAVPGAAVAVGFSLLAGRMEGEVLRRVFGAFLLLLAGVQFFSNKLVKIAEKWTIEGKNMKKNNKQ